MSAPAVRSRLLELRRRREAAAHGAALLDRKREVVLRALLEHRRALARLRAEAGERMAEARRHTALARIELGEAGLDAAAAGQPEALDLRRLHSHLVGVAIPRLEAGLARWRPSWSPGGTSHLLDAAGRAWAEALPILAHLASAEAAVLALEAGLRRTIRRQGALEHVVLPQLDAELRAIGEALEEEARDEAVRRRRSAAARRHATAGRP